jgi:hypothetical protein
VSGSTFQVSYVLDDVLEILRAGRNKKLFASRPVRAASLDEFLCSGRFNSVLGLDGFRIFKNELEAAVERLDDTPLAPTHVLEVLLHSGVHYADEHRPSRIPALAADPRRPAAYRHLAKSFARLSWADFTALVARVKGSRGRSAHVADRATGDDVVELDAYLRAVVTPLCEDLLDFVMARRHAPWRLPVDLG